MKYINLKIVLILMASSLLVNCAGFNKKIKSLVSGKPAASKARSSRTVSYNQRKSYQTNMNRNYKRMTKNISPVIT